MSQARHARHSFTVRWALAGAALLAGAVASLVLFTSSGPGRAQGATSTTTTPTTTAEKSRARTHRSVARNQQNTVSATFLPDTLTARGIYEFSGGNSGTDADNPDLAGTTLTFEWSQLEPEPGQFSWTIVDNAIAPWAAAGKQVILRVSAGGEAAWGAAAAQATPTWVYAQGVPAVHDDGATLPVYWNATFLADYDAFIAAYAARYDGDPAVSFIEVGIGDGGETLPDTQEGPGNRLALWAPYGYTDALWLATVENIATTYREDFRSTPVVPLVDSTFLGPARWSDYVTLTGWFSAHGFSMQYDGLTSTSTPQDGSWGQTTTVMEQRGPTSTSGDSLAGDCADATGPMHSSLILIYQSDIDNPANAEALSACASSVAP
jgi:hypothetical protein